MTRSWAIAGIVLVTVWFSGCGGDDIAEERTLPVELRAPEPPEGAAGWIRVDSTANAVTLDIVAGSDATNNNWNFNGYASGNFTVSVPKDATVTINFSNADPNAGHSIGVSEKPAGPWPATPDPTPVFEGAVSSNPTSMTESTAVGESETISFAASAPGEYALVCHVPGHATAGMWINFTVEPTGVMEG